MDGPLPYDEKILESKKDESLRLNKTGHMSGQDQTPKFGPFGPLCYWCRLK